MAAMRRPPVDPELQPALQEISRQFGTITPDSIRSLRETPSAGLPEDLLADAGVVRVDRSIAGHEGEEIEVTVLARADHRVVGPGIFYVHGGGMIAGDHVGPLGGMLHWIVDHDAVLVSVGYRLAPEFPDPYPVEDCYAGLCWTVDHADELGLDPTRLILAGASAGGGLAAGTALLARDRGGPEPAGQLLICPMLDDRDGTLSTRQYADLGSWVRASNVTGWSALLGDRRGTDEVSPYAAPARARDLTGLPPAYIDCGDAEVFRDEDVAYAGALWAAGVPAELHVWAGGFHGFDGVAPDAAVSRAALAARDAWVARVIGTTPTREAR